MIAHNAVLIAAYRAKAAEALELGRRARLEGREAAARGYLDQAIHWEGYGHAVSESAQEVTQSWLRVI